MDDIKIPKKDTRFKKHLYRRNTKVTEINSITDLLPNSPVSDNVSGFWDLIPSNDKGNSLIEKITNIKYDFEIRLLKFNNVNVDGPSDDDGYSKYLQFPDKHISDLAKEITNRSDTNDEKMYKIEQWVLDNIDYKSDLKNYGQNEYWALPTMTVNRGSGDCEDLGFLIHSLGLHAGVPHDRLRTYGGFVKMGDNSYQLGGHGWTAYKRESDDKWTVLDGSYYTTDEPINERTPMKDDYNYVEDFFYITKDGTVNAEFSNFIRNPDNSLSFVSNTSLKGGLINEMV